MNEQSQYIEFQNDFIAQSVFKWDEMRYAPGSVKVNAFDLIKQLKMTRAQVELVWKYLCQRIPDLNENVDYFKFKTGSNDVIAPVVTPSQALTIISYLVEFDSFAHFAITNHIGKKE